MRTRSADTYLYSQYLGVGNQEDPEVQGYSRPANVSEKRPKSSNLQGRIVNVCGLCACAFMCMEQGLTLSDFLYHPLFFF